jgi:hypothetical protein
MRKSLVLFTLFLLFAGCRFLPTKMFTPLPLEIEITLNSPGTLATSTLTITQSNTPFSTILPTYSLTSSPVITFSETPTVLLTATHLPYQLQISSPVYIKNFNHPDSGCNWLGVAGQVFNVNGKPLENLVVVIKGKLGEKIINSVMLTGLEEAKAYGPGGYEIFLYDRAIGSTKTLVIYVNDLQGNLLSPITQFDSVADCNKNIIIINFNELD